MYSEDDTASLHVQTADESRPLTGEVRAPTSMPSRSSRWRGRPLRRDPSRIRIPGRGRGVRCGLARKRAWSSSVRACARWSCSVTRWQPGASRRAMTCRFWLAAPTGRPIDGFSSKRSANTFLLGHGSHGSPLSLWRESSRVWGSQSRLSGRVVQGRRALVHSVLPGRRCRARGLLSGSSSVVEHLLPKQRVEGSNPFSRSRRPLSAHGTAEQLYLLLR